MNCNKIYKATMTYFGNEFYTHVYKKDNIYKVFFADETFTLYDFYTNGYASVPLILEQCKNGERLNVSWKYYRETNKKIIVSVAKAIA